jgi:hypothetical protein
MGCSGSASLMPRLLHGARNDPVAPLVIRHAAGNQSRVHGRVRGYARTREHEALAFAVFDQRQPARGRAPENEGWRVCPRSKSRLRATDQCRTRREPVRCGPRPPVPRSRGFRRSVIQSSRRGRGRSADSARSKPSRLVSTADADNAPGDRGPPSAGSTRPDAGPRRSVCRQSAHPAKP